MPSTENVLVPVQRH